MSRRWMEPKIGRLYLAFWLVEMGAFGGIVDSSFDPGLGANNVVRVIKLQPDGRILLGGEFTEFNNVARRGLVRLESDGTVDSSFQPPTAAAGLTNAFSIHALALQSDGRILAGGEYVGSPEGRWSHLVRLLPDGSLDTSFSPTICFDLDRNRLGSQPGTIRVDALAVQTDGDILASGVFYPAGSVNSVSLIRLNTDGSLDTVLGLGFGEFVRDIQFDSSGGILIAGTFQNYGDPDFRSDRVFPALRRLKEDGTRDVALENRLPYEFDTTTLRQNANGDWLIGGSLVADRYSRHSLTTLAARFRVDSSEVKVFPLESGGTVNAIDAQLDGSILIGGLFETVMGKSRVALARLLPDGGLDQCFAPGRTLSGSFSTGPTEIQALQAFNNRLALIAGNFTSVEGVSRPGVARLRLDADCPPELVEFSSDEFRVSRDFGVAQVVIRRSASGNSEITVDFSTHDGTATSGKDYTGVQTAVRFAAGELTRTVEIPVRYDSSNLQEKTLSLTLANPRGGASLGRQSSALLRINAGAVFDRVVVEDRSFAGIESRDWIGGFALQPDGKIVVGICEFGATPAELPYLIRLSADGAREASFPVGTGPDRCVYLVRSVPNGQVLVSGAFSKINGKSCPNLARLNQDGSLDETFVPPQFIPIPGNESSFSPIPELLPYGDGRVLVAGSFRVIHGARSRDLIARLQANGSLDPTFQIASERLVSASILSLDSGDRIIVGESARSGINCNSPWNTDGCYSNRRLLQNGEWDPTFVFQRKSLTIAGLATGIQPPRKLVSQSDGKLLFSTYPSSAANYSGPGIVRLNPDGSPDFGFAAPLFRSNPRESFPHDSYIADFKLTPDGRILVAGGFDWVNGVARTALAWFLPNGYLDLGISTALPDRSENGVIAHPEVNQIEFQTQDRFVALLRYRMPDHTYRSVVKRFAIVATNSVSSYQLALATTNSFSESQAEIEILVVRTGDARGPGSVRYRTESQSAQAGSDFMPLGGVLQFEPGQKCQVLRITLVNDERAETNETFRLALSEPSTGSKIGDPAAIELNIVDDDRAIEFDNAAVSAGELSRNVAVIVRRTGLVNVSTTVDYFTRNLSATAGEDYVAQSGSLRFTWPWETSKTINIPIRDDASFEGDEMFQVILANPTGGTVLGEIPVATVTIKENDSLEHPGQGADGIVLALAAQPDGRVLVGGAFTTLHGTYRPALARVLPDLSIDRQFNADFRPGDEVRRIALQRDGKVLVAGTFASSNGIPQERLLRLGSDGVVDQSFKPTISGGINFIPPRGIMAIVVQPDGRILVGGTLTNVNGMSRNGLARLEPDGTLDAFFRPQIYMPSPGELGNYVAAIALDAGANVVIGGSFSAIQGIPRNGLARLSQNGTLDPNFTPNLFGGFTLAGEALNQIRAVLIEADGGIIALRDPYWFSYDIPMPKVVRFDANGSRDLAFEKALSRVPIWNPYVALRDVVGNLWVGGVYGLNKFDPLNQPDVDFLESTVGSEMPPPPYDPPGVGPFPTQIRLGPPVVTAIVSKPDGRIVIGGNFVSVGRLPAYGLAELYPDGTRVGSLRIRSLRFQSDFHAELAVTVPENKEVVLESSPNLNQWQMVWSGISFTNEATIVDPQKIADTPRFYRLRLTSR